MRKALQSSRHGVAALVLIATAVIFYGVFFVGGSTVQATTNAQANAACGVAWNAYKSYAEVELKLKGAEAIKYADTKNKATKCQGEGASGFCAPIEDSESPVNICGATQDAAGKPASKEGLEKAKEAMEKKPEEKGQGGGGGGMPQIPPPPPKQDKPPEEKPPQDQGRCPKEQRWVDGTCVTKDGKTTSTKATSTKATSTNPAADFLKNAPDKVRSFLESLFGGDEKPGMDVTKAGGGTHTFEGQLKAIANSADPESPANKVIKAYIKGQKTKGQEPLSTKQFNALRLATEADPEGAAKEVRLKFPEVNDLLPASASFREGSAGFDDTSPQPTFVENVVTTLTGWIKKLFGS